MLSRLAKNAGRLVPAVRANLKARNTAMVSVRTNVTTSQEQLDTWAEVNDIFYGPDRDFKNFPTEKIAETGPPTRFGFIPEGFFTAFHDKTGISGPYVFGAVVLTTCMSKELLVIEWEQYEAFVWLFMIFAIKNRWGSGIEKYLLELTEHSHGNMWQKPLEAAKEQQSVSLKEIETTIYREPGRKYIYEAYREMVDLQLEEEYRARLANVHHTIKNVLDYHVDVENAKRRFEQTHMVNWIVDSVLKGITPQQERDSINKCISDLKLLSQKAQVA